jgi:phage baseplate assembly protein W
MSGYYADWINGQYILRAASIEEQVRDSIRSILLTRKGERRLHAELGSNIHRYLFKPLSEGVVEEMRSQIRLDIENGEPRVRILEIQILPDSDVPERIGMLIHFELKSTLKSGQARVELYA